MDYKLEKQIWTDADFEQMGWHDCNIYKIRLTEDLELDIDYILQWNKPDFEGLPFTFWVAPATLVFKSVQDLAFDFDIGFDNAFEIEDVEKEDGNRWTIITRQGDIQFRSKGYEQYIRQEPFLSSGRQSHSLNDMVIHLTEQPIRKTQTELVKTLFNSDKKISKTMRT